MSIPPQSYYHLSFNPHLDEVEIKTRIPYSITPSEMEDTTTKRFCMASSVENCLNSVSHLFSLLTLYPYLSFNIYTNYSNIIQYYSSEYLHTNKLVFDAYYTREIWVLEEIKLLKLGELELHPHHLGKKTPVALFNNSKTLHPSHYRYEFHDLEYSLTSYRQKAGEKIKSIPT